VIQSENLNRKEVSFINRDVAVFAFFLFLSFLFWYLNSLGKVVEADITYPASYINLPKGKVIVEDKQVKLNLFLKGTGYSILKLKLSGSRNPIIIDVSKVRYRSVQGNKDFNYFMVISGITKNLITQLKSDCEITSVKPDTLFFTLEQIATESMPSEADNEVIK